MAASSKCALCAGAGLSGEDRTTLYNLHTAAAGLYTYTYTTAHYRWLVARMLCPV